MPEYFDPPCDALDLTYQGKSLVVVNEDNCLKQLIPSESANSSYPAIPVQLSPTSIELRDGSAEFPIPLPNIKTQTGGSIYRILYRDTGGNIVNWFPENESCLNHKLIFNGSSFSFVPDCLPSILCADVCDAETCADYDYVLGLREFEIECDEETITLLKLVKIPKSLIPTCLEGGEV